MKQLAVGDKVRIKTPEEKSWSTAGTVVAKLPHRSYNIKLMNGAILRRNRRHIRLFDNKLNNSQDDDSNDDNNLQQQQPVQQRQQQQPVQQRQQQQPVQQHVQQQQRQQHVQQPQRQHGQQPSQVQRGNQSQPTVPASNSAPQQETMYKTSSYGRPIKPPRKLDL